MIVQASATGDLVDGIVRRQYQGKVTRIFPRANLS